MLPNVGRGVDCALSHFEKSGRSVAILLTSVLANIRAAFVSALSGNTHGVRGMLTQAEVTRRNVGTLTRRAANGPQENTQQSRRSLDDIGSRRHSAVSEDGRHGKDDCGENWTLGGRPLSEGKCRGYFTVGASDGSAIDRSQEGKRRRGVEEASFPLNVYEPGGRRSRIWGSPDSTNPVILRSRIDPSEGKTRQISRKYYRPFSRRSLTGAAFQAVTGRTVNPQVVASSLGRGAK